MSSTMYLVRVLRLKTQSNSPVWLRQGLPASNFFRMIALRDSTAQVSNNSGVYTISA